MIGVQQSARQPTIARAAADLVLAICASAAAASFVERSHRDDDGLELIEVRLRPIVGPIAMGAYELALRWLA